MPLIKRLAHRGRVPDRAAATDVDDPHVFVDPLNTAEGKLGFRVQIDANASGLFSSAGTWAVTAP
ncbi:MAG: hypothetical protein WBP81_01015 [Solirubrobacteraceae bacterium]